MLEVYVLLLLLVAVAGTCGAAFVRVTLPRWRYAVCLRNIERLENELALPWSRSAESAAKWARGLAAATKRMDEDADRPISRFVDHLHAESARLEAMPANTDAERDARIAYWVAAMGRYSKTAARGAGT